MVAILIVILTLLIPFPVPAASITISVPDAVVARVTEVCARVKQKENRPTLTQQQCAEVIFRTAVLQIISDIEIEAAQIDLETAKNSVEGLWPKP
jgi:hypothetical protein